MAAEITTNNLTSSATYLLWEEDSYMAIPPTCWQ